MISALQKGRHVAMVDLYDARNKMNNYHSFVHWTGNTRQAKAAEAIIAAIEELYGELNPNGDTVWNRDLS